MHRLFCIALCRLGLLTVFGAGLGSVPASADPGDIDAAARGVVRVVLIDSSGEEIAPLTHGSGFAVTPTRIVTNAHVIREALLDDTLRIAIVPSEGDEATFGKPVAVSPRNDLALIEVPRGTLHLPPLTMAGALRGDTGEVSAVGYPMNVDLAQGLEIGDIFRAQPPVKSRGFLSGKRPSRQFDTILHTAPIARGNSGGPLLDSCGRVVGVNSFGADSAGSDAEFYFAVSLRELLPFLRENGVEPQVNALPCRSLDDLNAAERARLAAEQDEARRLGEERAAGLSERRADARMRAQMSVLEERDDALALAFALLLAGIGAAYVASRYRARLAEEPELKTRAIAVAALAGAAIVAAALVWMTRPGFADVEDRVAMLLDEGLAGAGGEGKSASGPLPRDSGGGSMICTLDPDRSRVTSARTDDVAFEWAAGGCVNQRTQYARTDGGWTRVLVPGDEATVSVNTYDPGARSFRTDRYLLSRTAMEEVRAARAGYEVPACGVTDAARTLREQQAAVLAKLSDRPNERLVYSCTSRASAMGGGE